MTKDDFLLHCSGDSGGPLLHLGDGCGENDALVGLTSFGYECFQGDSDTPSIYSRVESFQEWINSFGKGEVLQFHNPSCTRDPPAALKNMKFEEQEKGDGEDLPDLNGMKHEGIHTTPKDKTPWLDHQLNTAVVL